MNKFEKPLRTELLWNNYDDSSVSILGETEKAILIVVSYSKKKGTSMASNIQEFEKWIPKSVWNNRKNYETIKFKGDGDFVTYFKPPYFLR